MSERGMFNGKTGFILATAASAVGLGNIWRFPTEAADNGGGSFLLIYLVIVVAFGLAMMATEIAIGRMTRKSPIDAFNTLNPKWKIVGTLSSLVPAIILPYYCVIGGWLLGYIIGYAGGMDMASSSMFGDFSGSWYAVICTLAFILMMAVIIFKGVSKGIEKISIVFMPVFIILLVALTIYVLMQPGMADGVSYYLSFDTDNLSGDTFISALSQVFFSLSIAMGILITYGSYMSKNESIGKCSLSIIAIDTVVAVAAGLFIVPMAYHYSGGDISGGAGLVFITLPKIFETMTAGPVVAAFFFLMVLFAALTSAVSVCEAVTSTVIDRKDAHRKRATVWVILPTSVVAILISLGYGPLDFITIAEKNLLDIFDYIACSILMPIVAILICVFVGHILGSDKVLKELESSGKFVLKPIYPLLIKWVCPILLALIFISSFGLF